VGLVAYVKKVVWGRLKNNLNKPTGKKELQKKKIEDGRKQQGALLRN